MSSQGEKKIYLEANQKGYPVRAAGDFVYVRSAPKPIRVIIDGQPIVMEAGEKRRIPRSEVGQLGFDSFEVDNLSDSPQSVTLVVGEGDYEKLIVSGQLNVSAYISTSVNGESKSLPVVMDKEVGFVSGSASTWNANDTIATVSTAWGDYLVDGYGKNICFFDGFFWRVSKHSLIRISAVDATVVETVAFIFNGHTLDSFSGPAVEIPWLVSLENGKFAFRDANTIYTVDSRTGDLAVLFGTPTGAVSTYLSNRNRTGAFYYDGWIYYTDQVGSNDIFFKRANIKTLDIEKLQSTHNNEGLHGNFDVGANITLRYTDAGVPEVWSYVGVGSPVSSILGVYIRDESTPSNGLTQMAIHPYQPLSAEVVNGSEFANHRLLRYEDGGSFGEIYLQEVGDVASRISIQLETPIDFWNRNGSVVGRGDLVGHFIKAIARNSVPNYLDYVVSLTYNDGYSDRTIDAGTQSWALRGIVDDVEVIMPSAISLEVLPDVFNL